MLSGQPHRCAPPQTSLSKHPSAWKSPSLNQGDLYLPQYQISHGVVSCPEVDRTLVKMDSDNIFFKNEIRQIEIPGKSQEQIHVELGSPFC